MQGGCDLCGRLGNWPIFFFESHCPDKDGPRRKPKSFCPDCYAQIGAPFPDELTDRELRRWQDDVVEIFREHLRKMTSKPKVHSTDPKLVKYELGNGRCTLCYAQFQAQAPRPFIWEECDKIIRPCRVCLECGAICGVSSA